MPAAVKVAHRAGVDSGTGVPVPPPRRAERLVLGVPALVGTVALLLVTRKGVYASPDSAFYVGTARNLLDGHGFTAPPGSPPLSHFPPLFPLVLAAVGSLTGLDPLDAAAIVNPLLLGVTALLVAAVVHRRSGSVALGVWASAAVVAAVDLLVFFASALSEPLFVVLVLAAMVALTTAVGDGRRWLWVAAVALTAGACLARYVGVALVAAEVVVLMAVGGRRMAGRAVAAAAASLAPLAVWLAVAGRGNRPVVVHLFGADYWVDGFRSLSRWVLPPYVPWPVRGLATVAVAAGLVTVALVARRRDRSPDPDSHRHPDVLSLLLPVFTVAYLVVLVADRVFLDATGRLDLRFLGVLHVVAFVGLAPWLHRTLKGQARPVAAIGLALLVLQALYAGSWVVDGLSDTSVGRRGLTAAAWEDSTVLAAAAALPPDITVYSNAPEAVFLITGRAASPLPAHTDYLSGRPRPEYGDELAAMTDRLSADRGVVVWLRPYAFRQPLLAPVEDLGLEPVLEDEVGRLSRRAAG